MRTTPVPKGKIERVPEFDAYCVGVCYAKVCTSLTIEEACARLNEEEWAGDKFTWKKAKSGFTSGKKNPHPSPKRPHTHRNILFAIDHDTPRGLSDEELKRARK